MKNCFRNAELNFGDPIADRHGSASLAFAEPYSAERRMMRVDYRDVSGVAAIALTEDRLLFGTFELCAESESAPCGCADGRSPWTQGFFVRRTFK